MHGCQTAGFTCTVVTEILPVKIFVEGSIQQKLIWQIFNAANNNYLLKNLASIAS